MDPQSSPVRDSLHHDAGDLGSRRVSSSSDQDGIPSENGEPIPFVNRRLQKSVSMGDDGKLIPFMNRRLQKSVSMGNDGKLIPFMNRRLQKSVSMGNDGKLIPSMNRRLQKSVTMGDVSQVVGLVREDPELRSELRGQDNKPIMDPRLLVAVMSGEITRIRQLVEEDRNVAFNLTHFPNLILHPELRMATAAGDVNRVCVLVLEDPKLLFGIILQLIPFMDPRLQQAVTAGDAGKVKRLVKENPQLLPGAGSQDYTPMDPRFLVAATSGDVARISQLVQEEPNITFGLTRFPNLILDPKLRWAAAVGDVARVAELVKEDPKLLFCIIRQLIPSMDPKLKKAVTTGDVAEVERLVSEKPEFLSGLRGHGYKPLDPRLLEAAASGDSMCLWKLGRGNPSLLDGITPDKNTALHIAVLSGHKEFVVKFCVLKQRTLAGRNSRIPAETNLMGETPLHLAAITGNLIIFSFLLDRLHEEFDPAESALMVANHRGDTALHLALQYGHTELAAKMLNAEPQLSQIVNMSGESPLYMAASRGFHGIVEVLLNSLYCHLGGPNGETILHVASAIGHLDIVRTLVEKRPLSIRATTRMGETALHFAAATGHLNVVQFLLKNDTSLAYALTDSFHSPLWLAAAGGHIHIMEELIHYCPDCVKNIDRRDRNILHATIDSGQSDVVQYILKTSNSKFHCLINQPDLDGNTPLHMAALKADPEILGSLLKDDRVDKKAVNLQGRTALTVFFKEVEATGTLQWNEAFLLLTKAIPSSDLMVLRETTNKKLIEKAAKEMQSMMEMYTKNTTLMATLMATVAFAAAFTVPGGYKSDSGQPVLVKKIAFQVFLISNTIAMCSSLSIAFFNFLMAWEKMENLIHFRASTEKLMWCAIIGLNVAFATGMFVMVAPDILWMAIFFCALCCSLPFLTYIVVRWPSYTMNYRLGSLWPKLLKPKPKHLLPS